MRNLVPFVQFKRREKHPWRSVTFRKVATFKSATLLKVILLHGCFSCFLNRTNGTKSRNASQMIFFLVSIFLGMKLLLYSQERI